MVPPVKGTPFAFDISLVSQDNKNVFQTSCTIEAGDVLVRKDGGTPVNIEALPVEGDTTGMLIVALSATEMDADRVAVRFHDVAGDEWQDAMVEIFTAAQTLDATDAIVDSILVDTGTDIPASIAALPTDADVETAAGAAITSAALATGAEIAALNDLDAEDVWTYPDRRMTMTVVVDNGTVTNNNITIHRGDTFIQPFSGLGSLAGCVSLDFMLKSKKSDADEAALIHIVYGSGLLTLNGEEAETADNGSITIVDEDAGNIVVRMEAAEVAELAPGTGYYDIQVITASSVNTPVEGRVKINEDVNRGVS